MQILSYLFLTRSTYFTSRYSGEKETLREGEKARQKLNQDLVQTGLTENLHGMSSTSSKKKLDGTG